MKVKIYSISRRVSGGVVPASDVSADREIISGVLSANWIKYHNDYPKFIQKAEALVLRLYSDDDEINETMQWIRDEFYDKTVSHTLDWVDEEEVDAVFKEPREGPKLTGRDFHPNNGWLSESRAKKLRLNYELLERLLGFEDEESMIDIQENALRILDVCNNPSDDSKHWGENRRGLVYGMVQSGKTANMISLIALSIRAGYRMIVILSGDKDSLRRQTQDRVNKAFGLEGGHNSDGKIGGMQLFRCAVHSPTYNSDFKGIHDTNYSANFKYNDRVIHKKDWCTIIVIKKETNHLNALIDQINQFRFHMGKDNGENMNIANLFPTLIIDDEADYASLNYKSKDITRINEDLINLRKALDYNCFAAYTATPQGCLMAADTSVGYPKDFWWMIEPLYEIVNGKRKNRSYLGVWEVFRSGYSSYLLHSMSDNEWPHHDKDPNEDWRSAGIRVPEGRNGLPPSIIRQAKDLLEIEEEFLDEILDDTRDSPPSVKKALMDHLITCGVRWWRNWHETRKQEKPTRDEIERSNNYKHHSTMIHLSLKQTSHKKIRRMIEVIWPSIKDDFYSFDPETSVDDHPFRDRWTRQIERTRYLIPNHPKLPYRDIKYFISKCIEITEAPIYNPKTSPLTTYRGKPWAYILNSNTQDQEALGMKLDYREDANKKSKAKKALIAVGGNILSRGLTLEGLSVSVYGRSAANEKQDTDLQRCRWLGHKMNYVDLLAIHLHDSAREVFRDIAEKDDILRRQLKLALHEFNTPMDALILLHNSPLVAPTSKSGGAKRSKNMGFSGTRVHLDSPSFSIDDIIENTKILKRFVNQNTEQDYSHKTRICRDFGTENTIKLLRRIKCPKGAPQVSFGALADYLDEWNKGNLKNKFSSVPRINIVVRANRKVQRKFNINDRPRSIEEAISNARNTFSTVPRGADSGGGTYRGDAFLDKPRDWHDNNPPPKGTKRYEGEDMLIVIYPLDPNYIREAYYDWSKRTKEKPEGIRVRVDNDIRLPKKHPFYVPKDSDGETPRILVYVAWVPKGGPTYDVWSNNLLDPKKLKQRGFDLKPEE